MTPDESFQLLLSEFNAKGKRKNTSTGMQSVLQLLLDYPDWWWSWEIVGKTNSKGEWISHRGPARASDLAIHYPDLVESRKISRYCLYRARTENMDKINQFLIANKI